MASLEDYLHNGQEHLLAYIHEQLPHESKQAFLRQLCSIDITSICRVFLLHSRIADL
jgi:hypothetical protein